MVPNSCSYLDRKLYSILCSSRVCAVAWSVTRQIYIGAQKAFISNESCREMKHFWCWLYFLCSTVFEVNERKERWYIQSRNCRLLITQQGCWNICAWCSVKKKVSNFNPGNQICITFQSSVLTVRPFKFLFIYRLRFSSGVLLSQNKLVSYRLCVCVCVWVKPVTIGAWEGGIE